jgi:hypothetical protein
MADSLFEDGRVYSFVRTSLAGAQYSYLKPGDCPRFTDRAKRRRRIGTVPDETEEFGCAGWGRLAGLWHDLGRE